MKLVDKYLDEYYSGKLLRALEACLIMKFNAPCRFVEDKGRASIESKLKGLEDIYYIPIYTFNKSDAFAILCNLEEAETHLCRRYKEAADTQRRTVL